MKTKIQKIEQQLQKSFFCNQKLSQELFMEQLADNIGFLKNSMREDNNDYILSLVVEEENTAIILIMKNEENSYVNEKAIQKLKILWPKDAFMKNLDLLIPGWSRQLIHNEMPHYGFSIIERKPVEVA